VIEIVRILGDPLQRLGQFWLTKKFPLLVEVSIALKNASRGRKLRQIWVLQILCVFPCQRVSIARQ
jgi:hypothetical protein